VGIGPDVHGEIMCKSMHGMCTTSIRKQK